MGTSNVKRLQLIVFLGLAAFFAMGYTVVQRGITEIVKFGQGGMWATGPQAKSTRVVSDFDRVEAGGIFEVDVTFGSRPAVTFEAPKDLLPHLTANIERGSLQLRSNVQFNTRGNARVRAHIVTRHLRGVTVSGAAKMVINGRINESSFDVDASGASTLKLSAAVDRFKLDASGAAKTNISSLGAHSLNIDASGAAECTIVGNVQSSKIGADGAATINGQLTSNSANVQTRGAAHATLRVINSFTGEADGASSISYSGKPSQVRIHTSGVASINRG